MSLNKPDSNDNPRMGTANHQILVCLYQFEVLNHPISPLIQTLAKIKTARRECQAVHWTRMTRSGRVPNRSLP